MSGEDGELDDGPPVLVAFEYPPEDNGNEMPLDFEELPEKAATANDDASGSEDDGETLGAAEEEQDSKTGESQHESRSRRKRRHHRRSSRHRKSKESSKPSAPTKPAEVVTNNTVPPVDFLAPGVGEWASLFMVGAVGDSSPKISKIPGRTDGKDKLLPAQGKSQYDVDDVDPYATPEGSEDEEGGKSSAKEPLANVAVGNNYSQEHQGNNNMYPPDSSFPPRKRLRDDSFDNRPFRPRDEGKFFNRDDRGGFRHGYDDVDEPFGGRRGSRSPGDQWRNRRDRGMRRGRGGMGPRRPRNDYDQMQPPIPEVGAGYESHYDDHFGQGSGPGPEQYHHHHHQEVPFQPPPPPPSFQGGPPLPPPPPEMLGPPDNPDHQEIYPYDEPRHGMPRRREDDMGDQVSRNDRRRDRESRGGRRKGDRGDRDRPPPQNDRSQNDRPGLICRFFREGNCLKGANCNFAHILPSEIKRKPELCKFYLGGFCIKGDDCDYLHQQFPCKFFHTSGNCRNGDHCRFSHAVLDDEGQKLLDKAISSWGNERAGPQGEGGPESEQRFYPPEDQQQGGYQQGGYMNNGNGLPNQGPPGQPPPGFYGVDSLMGPVDQNNFSSPPQNRPPFMPPQGYPGDHDRPPFEPPPPPFHGGDFMPPPPNFPPMPPPYMPQNPTPGGPQHSAPPFYPPMPNDMNSPPQFRPPVGMSGSGFPPSSPSAGYSAPPMSIPNAGPPMPPLPPTLSAEQIHQLASQPLGMPGMPPIPPYAQSPPDHLHQSSSSMSSYSLPGTINSDVNLAGATSPTGSSRDPRLSTNRTAGETGGERRPVKYKLISVLIPPPVPLSLALRLDPLDPIIRLDPRLRKVFGLTNP